MYQLWQAEGFIQAHEKNKSESKGVSSYDIAEQYLEELVKRCMIEVEEVYGNGGIKTCRRYYEDFVLEEVQRGEVLGSSHRG